MEFMKYKILKPMADGEAGELAQVDWTKKRREIRRAHIYLFSQLECDIIQAYPFFIATKSICLEFQKFNITGIEYIPLIISRSMQYGGLPATDALPELQCFEPCGIDGVDDVIYHSEVAIKVSEKFIKIAGHHSISGCEISDYL